MFTKCQKWNTLVPGRINLDLSIEFPYISQAYKKLFRPAISGRVRGCTHNTWPLFCSIFNSGYQICFLMLFWCTQICQLIFKRFIIEYCLYWLSTSNIALWLRRDIARASLVVFGGHILWEQPLRRQCGGGGELLGGIFMCLHTARVLHGRATIYRPYFMMVVADMKISPSPAVTPTPHQTTQCRPSQYHQAEDILHGK